MNRVIVFMAFIISILLIHGGIASKARVDDLKNKISILQIDNIEMKQKIRSKDLLPRQAPVPIRTAYNKVLNQIRLLESYSGTKMGIQLEGAMDTQDITNHFENTGYDGVKGLRIKIVVDKFSNETDMGAVLDDIHLLEMNTDFIASEINQDNDHLIVKGEVYGF